MSSTQHTEQATFAAGCFWGVEEAFRRLDGVIETEVGYTGGHVDSPTYEQVCRGDTGHAEAVRVRYDPSRISLEQLLDVFWREHDPTQKDRQGPDVGHQYRSAVFVRDERQRQTVERSRDALQASGRLRRPVATTIEPEVTFWRAEEYHQQYFAKRGISHCRIG